MPLTPEEIEGRPFPIEFRGYDRAAVDNFLSEVAKEFRALQRRAEELTPPSGEPPSAAEPPWRPDHELARQPDAGESPNLLLLRTRDEARRVIDAAEELSLRIVDSARRSLQEAEEQAAKIVGAAHAQAVKYVERALECNDMLVEVERGLRPPREAFEAALISFRDALERGEITADETPPSSARGGYLTAAVEPDGLSEQLRQLREEVLAERVGGEEDERDARNGRGGDELV